MLHFEVRSDQFSSLQFISVHFRSDQFRSGQVRSVQIRSDQINMWVLIAEGAPAPLGFYQQFSSEVVKRWTWPQEEWVTMTGAARWRWGGGERKPEPDLEKKLIWHVCPDFLHCLPLSTRWPPPPPCHRGRGGVAGPRRFKRDLECRRRRDGGGGGGKQMLSLSGGVDVRASVDVNGMCVLHRPLHNHYIII